MPPSSARGLSVAKLFVGVSIIESDTAKLVGVKLLPLPDESLPSVVAVVPELSSNFNLNPFVPKVNSDVSLGSH